MNLDLHGVTLLIIETQCHKLARLAVQDCLKVADFGDIIIASDNFNILRIPGAQHIRVPNWSDKTGYCKFLWHDAARYVKTPQCMIIQWDSWIINPQSWSSKFLEYDYIGSPWRFKDDFNVGNSGFSLRSKRLMDYLYNNQEKYPITNPQEDSLLCRSYQGQIIKETDFHWAPEKLAHQFSFEVNKQYPDPFGFHGIFNWPEVLSSEKLIERLTIAKENEYISSPDRFWYPVFQFVEENFNANVTYNKEFWTDENIELAASRNQKGPLHPFELIEKHLPIKETDKVLDFGCGTGQIAKAIVEKYNCTVIGADLSDSMKTLAL
ncbi:MAG TPA: DUF5672 family protein, partial [Methylomirabilota bacterium]|nr:DUF5672 family protein [Methylomirabilota bacterium]